MSFNDLYFQDETGLHTPDYDTILQYLIDQTKTIFGDDINLDPDTKDGQYLAIFATATFDSSQVGQQIYNSFSPFTAIGKALSTQVGINGMARRLATNSEVDLDIGGTAGTIIENGIAADDLDQKWLLPASVTIPPGGTITITAIAKDVGGVSAAPNTVTRIFTTVIGWQTVNNLSDAAPGVSVETDAELRARQKLSGALPSRTVMEATVGAVASVNGVSRFRGYENDTEFVDANGIPPHTISIVAQGGDDEAIAQAIWSNKTPGTGTYGTTNVIIFDEFGTPSDIKFYRPTDAIIGVSITLEALPGFISTTEDLVKQSIADYLNNLAIGDDVYLSRLYTPANLYGAPESDTYDITILEINKNGGGFAAANIVLTFIESAVCDPDTDIALVVI